MTILITGATGKVGRSLVKRLGEAGQSILLATRSGTFDGPYKTIKFDWFDEKTYSTPFDADTEIDKVFLVSPDVFDTLDYVKPFVELAIVKGVKRFVHVSSSALEKGDDVGGKVHEYLANRGIEYSILRPSTFIENFGSFFLQGIRERDAFFAAGGTGKVAVVSVEDIADAAFDVLISRQSPTPEVVIVGPQLYSYDEIAKALSEVLGRKISYRSLSREEYVKTLESFGVEKKYAGMLGYISNKIADGSEEAITKTSGVFIGTRTLLDYIEANKDIWMRG